MADLPPLAQVQQRQLVPYNNAGQVPIAGVNGGGELATLAQAVGQGATSIAQGFEPSAMAMRYQDAINGAPMSNTERLLGLFPALDVIGGGLLTGAKVPLNALASNALRRQPDMPTSSTMDVPDYTTAAGSDPRYLGAAPDRSDFDFPRYTPKKNRPRTQNAVDNIRKNEKGIKDEIIRDIMKGQKLGGSDWYNTEELRDWFVKAKGPEVGDAEWREYMYLMGATSSGNKVPTNMGVASYYRNKGPEWIKENYERLNTNSLPQDLKPPTGYGHKMQANHAMNSARLMNDEWVPSVDGSVKHGNWTQNPKPKGFANSLLGNKKNIAADLHFTRYMAMADGSPDWLSTSSEIGAEFANSLADKYGASVVNKYITLPKTKDGKPKFNAKKAVSEGAIDFNDLKNQPTVFEGKPSDNEYAAFEDVINEIGQELGMTGPQVQANLWMGAADRTGVDPMSQGTFMELFRKRAAETAKKTNRTQQEVIDNFINNRGLLSVSSPPITPMLQENEMPQIVGLRPNEA